MNYKYEFRVNNKKQKEEYIYDIDNNNKMYLVKYTNTKERKIADIDIDDEQYTRNWNIYSTDCIFNGENFDRETKSIKCSKGFFIDFDIKDSDKKCDIQAKHNYRIGKNNILNILQSDNFKNLYPYHKLISTGNGFHCHFKNFIDLSGEDREDLIKLHSLFYTDLAIDIYNQFNIYIDTNCKDIAHLYRVYDSFFDKDRKFYNAKDENNIKVINIIENLDKDATNFYRKRIINVKEKDNKQKTSVNKKSSYNKNTNSVLNQTTLDDVRHCLDHFKCSDNILRDEWRNIGLAIHDLNDTEEAFEIWNEWSKEDITRYSETECKKQWDSFEKKEDGITIATLFKITKDKNPEYKPLLKNKYILENDTYFIGDDHCLWKKDTDKLGNPKNIKITSIGYVIFDSVTVDASNSNNCFLSGYVANHKGKILNIKDIRAGEITGNCSSVYENIINKVTDQLLAYNKTYEEHVMRAAMSLIPIKNIYKKRFFGFDFKENSKEGMPREHNSFFANKIIIDQDGVRKTENEILCSLKNYDNNGYNTSTQFLSEWDSEEQKNATYKNIINELMHCTSDDIIIPLLGLTFISPFRSIIEEWGLCEAMNPNLIIIGASGGGKTRLSMLGSAFFGRRSQNDTVINFDSISSTVALQRSSKFYKDSLFLVDDPKQKDNYKKSGRAELEQFLTTVGNKTGYVKNVMDQNKNWGVGTGDNLICSLLMTMEMMSSLQQSITGRILAVHLNAELKNNEFFNNNFKSCDEIHAVNYNKVMCDFIKHYIKLDIKNIIEKEFLYFRNVLNEKYPNKDSQHSRVIIKCSSLLVGYKMFVDFLVFNNILNKDNDKIERAIEAYGTVIKHRIETSEENADGESFIEQVKTLLSTGKVRIEDNLYCITNGVEAYSDKDSKSIDNKPYIGRLYQEYIWIDPDPIFDLIQYTFRAKNQNTLTKNSVRDMLKNTNKEYKILEIKKVRINKVPKNCWKFKPEVFFGNGYD